MKNKNKECLNFLAETGLLKRVKRSGWWVVGIKDPESVAEHSFRCAVIGYLLAKLEKADAYAVTMMCLFNDLHEARINDFHKMAARYINYKQAEDRAYQEQIEFLPGAIKKELAGWRAAYTSQKTKEGIIARDADILECLVQAKEYSEQGFAQAKLFLKKAPRFLKTKSARNLFRQLKGWDTSRWWQRVSEFKR
ncbi:MAG: HD domain-containing protein [Candidatus Omnitrophica bacterium]|nr:HD domain-containing protein [Candidatus Omnitrophota bacterium]MBU1924339.1 HD domain-containing protein [Candidatus Omnitrophota bacterium]